MPTGLEEENLKNDLVSHPVCAEGLVNTYKQFS